MATSQTAARNIGRECIHDVHVDRARPCVIAGGQSLKLKSERRQAIGLTASSGCGDVQPPIPTFGSGGDLTKVTRIANSKKPFEINKFASAFGSPIRY